MPETTTPQLTESDVAEIEARAKKYREFADRAATPGDEKVVRWFAKTVAALTRDWRALRAERDLLKSRTAYDWANIIETLQDENAALREQLAQTRTENERLASQLKEWQEERDTKAGYL